MDIGEIDVVTKANGGFSFNLLHPATNEETEIVIHCLGFDSDRVQKAEADASKSLMAEKSPSVSEALEVVRMAKVKAAFVRAENLEVRMDGKLVAVSTREEVLPHLEKPEFRVIVEQIISRAGNRASLFPKPPAD